jgi:diacylglycerol kinase (ATP)
VASSGFLHGLRHEAAIREVVIGVGILIAVSTALPLSRLEHLILVLATTQVVVAEFLNSAVETAVDRISTEDHHLSGLAKDYANVAVVLTVLFAGLAWLVIAGPLLLEWLSR